MSSLCSPVLWALLPQCVCVPRVYVWCVFLLCVLAPSFRPLAVPFHGVCAPACFAHSRVLCLCACGIRTDAGIHLPGRGGWGGMWCQVNLAVVNLAVRNSVEAAKKSRLIPQRYHENYN